MDEELARHYARVDEQNLHGDFKRKQVRIPLPKKMADIVSQLLAKRGYAQLQTVNAWEEAWQKVAGRFASQSRCGKLSRGVLEVLVANSAVLQELTFQKAKLLKYLGELLPAQKVKDLKLKVAAIN